MMRRETSPGSESWIWLSTLALSSCNSLRSASALYQRCFRRERSRKLASDIAHLILEERKPANGPADTPK